MIPVFSNDLGLQELEAVASVMRSRWLGTGKHCKKFEEELATHFRVERLLLTNCATSAIYLALRCLGIGEGDRVVIPTIHFVATINAVLEFGAEPILVDVDPQTLTITPEQVDSYPSDCIIINHYGGHPCWMANIKTASKGTFILEDAANAPVSLYDGKPVGTLGDAGVWSFDSMKILSMADGGALWLKEDRDHERAWRLRNLGLDTFSGKESAEKGGGRWWEFTVPEPSGRFDSNDLLACIGRAQLRRLSQNIYRRQQVWDFYQENLLGIGDLILPPEPLPGCTTSYYLYWVQTKRRDELARHLYSMGIYTTFRYYPLHRAFNLNLDLPGADYAADHTLNLPIHQNLTDEDLGYILECIEDFDFYG